MLSPTHWTPLQGLATQVRFPAVSTAQDIGGAQGALPHWHCPVVESQVWLRGQVTWAQLAAGRHALPEGSHTWPSWHAVPPVPPHLHVPSFTSQLVPPSQVIPTQLLDKQVFEPGSQSKPLGHTTPPRPPHLQTPSFGSHTSGVAQITF